MNSLIRKLFLLLASLALVFGAFLLYNRISGTSAIDLDLISGGGSPLPDVNDETPSGGGGRIGDVDVGVVEGADFVHRDENGIVDRKMGFAKLRNNVKNIWDVEKPYMSVIQRNFECHITADRGNFQLETALGDATPKDATFTGNVVIHVIPKGDGKFKESHIYLDDIVFLSEKSQFSTIGPVRFVSEMANMQGKGLKFVYDEQSERLEYLRLVHLERLHIRSLADALLSDGKKEVVTDPAPALRDAAQSLPSPPGDTQQIAVEPPRQPAPPPDSTTAETSDIAEPQDAPKIEGLYYKCILSKNVLIEAPDEIVFAGDRVSINDIFWSKSSTSDRDPNLGAVPPTLSEDAAEANLPSDVITESEPTRAAASDTTPPDSPVLAETPSKSGAEPNEPTPKIVDVIVTCDDGVLLLPEDSQRSIADQEFRSTSVQADTRQAKLAALCDEGLDKTSFISNTIDYSATRRDTIATGASELTFFTDDISDSDANNPNSDANTPPIPINIKASQGVRYLHAQNQVIFEGACVCEMPQTDLSQPRNAMLASPGITVDLLRGGTDNSHTSANITATGPVRLDFHVEDPNSDDPNSGPLPVTVTAQKHAKFLSATEQVIFDVNCVCTMPQQQLGGEGSYTFESPRLTVNMARGTSGDATGLSDVVASGPVKLTFYVDDFGSSASGSPLPATVTAQREARFSALANQVIFDGSCVCLMDRTDPNGQYEYKLEAPRLTVALPADSDDSSKSRTSSGGVERLTAHGGLVVLSTRRWPVASDRSEGQLLGGIVLQCRQFDYEPNEEVLIATGPGQIWFNNAKATESDPNRERASLRKPCYARVKNFDTLEYFLAKNHIVANAESEGSLVVDYTPLKDGRIEQVIQVTAGHVQAFLDENAVGDLELSSLSATQGVSCDDDTSQHYFEGSNLMYDHVQGIMTVTGSEDMPCVLDGALVEGIEYNLQTRTLRARPIGTGTLPLN